MHQPQRGKNGPVPTLEEYRFVIRVDGLFRGWTAVEHEVRSDFVLDEGRFFGEEEVEVVVVDVGVRFAEAVFDASLDGRFDLRGCGDVVVGIESFEHFGLIVFWFCGR